MRFINLFFTSAFLVAITSVQAQDLSEANVPESVRSAFSQEFPETQQSEWELENGSYKVEFKTTDHAENEVWYDASGKQIRWERDIFVDELPTAAVSKIRADYPRYIMEDVKVVVVDGKKTYELELEERGTGNDVDLRFDEEGNILDLK